MWSIGGIDAGPVCGDWAWAVQLTIATTEATAAAVDAAIAKRERTDFMATSAGWKQLRITLRELNPRHI
jgi:hypothetical protein